MARQSFLKGAMVLLIASVIVRIMGFAYQIVIIRIIGPEGIGIFNMIYPLYITAMVLVLVGFPPAVAKTVAEESAANNRGVTEKILGSAVSTLLLIATAGSLLLIIFAPSFLRLIYSDVRVIPAFLILIPSLLMIAVSSTIRGFFQGLQDMTPTALNQLIEQVIRFTFGIGLVSLLYPYGLTWAAVGLAGSVLLSELGGLIYLMCRFKRQAGRIQLLMRPNISILIRLLSFGIPVTVTRIVSTIVTSCEASLIPRQLMKAGSSLSQATSFYGELTGVAFTLLMIPSTLSFSLSTTLLPAVSEARRKKQNALLSRRASDALGITLIAGVPCAIILYNWGSLFAHMLFKAGQAGGLLQILALGSVFLYLSQTTTGILQGIGRVKAIFFNTLLAGTLRLAGIYTLGSLTAGGMAGIAASYVASFLLLALLNLFLIWRIAGFRLEAMFFLRLVFTSLILFYLLEFTAALAAESVLLLMLLTLANVFAYYLLLFLTGDKYIRILLEQIRLR